MISCKIFYSLNELNQYDWDNVVKDDRFMSYDYLLHLSTSMSNGFSHRYLMVYDEKTPVAVASMFTMKLDAGTLLDNNFLKGAVQTFRKFVKKAFYIRALVVGSPPSIGNKTIIVSNFCSNKNAVMDLIISNIEDHAKAEKIKLILYKEYDQDFLHNFENSFAKYQYITGTSLPNNVLNIKWESFEPYLNSMKKKYRDSIKVSLKKIDNHISIFCDHNLYDHYTEEAYSLYVNVLDKSNTVFETLSREYFRHSTRPSQINSALISMYYDNKLIGYFLAADLSSTELGVLFAGIDYEYRKRYDTYFNLVYESIKLAMLRQKTKISFGQNSYDFKKRIGCVPEHLFVLYKHKNKLINNMLKKLNKYLFPTMKLEIKSIFKDD